MYKKVFDALHSKTWIMTPVLVVGTPGTVSS